MLFHPTDFEELTETAWHSERVRAAVRKIVADAEEAFDHDGLWHSDERDLPYGESPLKDLYAGAAGIVLALEALRRRGHAAVALDLAGAALRTLELSEPDAEATSLFFGEAGISTVAYRLAPSQDLADRLFARVTENMNNDANELMWGAPGTMLIAHAMRDWTGDPRWSDAWAKSAAEVRRRRENGLWTQHLGKSPPQHMLGAAHGAVANQLALLQGSPIEDARDVAELLERTAVVEGPLANWSTDVDLELVHNGRIRVQWCHGAPGVVIAAAAYLPEELLLAGAELTWQAGPHGKGPGLCHGTAGNGYALLKAFERTGDELWLDRARRFAMHALEQADRRGRGYHALFTGDLGVALYAADCLDARARFPVLDGLD
ncbi:MAG: LanC-like protein [Actinomycetota bacterium]